MMRTSDDPWQKLAGFFPVQKGIRNSILETYPDIEPYIDTFLPKKDQFKVVKCHEHIELLVNSGGDLLFFRQVFFIEYGAGSF